MKAGGHDYRLGLGSFKSCCERWEKKKLNPYTDSFIPEPAIRPGVPPTVLPKKELR